jgi:hypothetical protein
MRSIGAESAKIATDLSVRAALAAIVRCLWGTPAEQGGYSYPFWKNGRGEENGKRTMALFVFRNADGQEKVSGIVCFDMEGTSIFGFFRKPWHSWFASLGMRLMLSLRHSAEG